MPHYEVVIIPIDKAVAANKDCDKVDTGKTSKSFTVPLWDEKADTQKDLPTYLWYCWWMSDAESAELKKDFDGDDKDKEGTKYKDKKFDLRDGWTPETILEKMKLKTNDAILISADIKKTK